MLCPLYYHLLPTQQAKAWVLAVLGTVVAYDLTQTSEDPWSLRVYRGEEEGPSHHLAYNMSAHHHHLHMRF